MARQERNDVDYFPHLVKHGKNMFIIDKKYGNDGYTVWFRTLEELCRVDFHNLNLLDNTRLMHLASVCNVSEERYLEIIDDLVKLGEFDEDLRSVGILWNQELVNSIQDAYRKRSNNCITVEELRIKYHLPVITPDSSGVMGDNSGVLQQTKLNYNKEEDSKSGNPYDFWKEEFKKTEKGTQRNRSGYHRLIGTICNEQPPFPFCSP